MRSRRLPVELSAEHANWFSLPFIQVNAPAKINLTLEVVGKRPDGFHELRSLMVAVDLEDQITLSGTPNGDLRMSLDLRIGGSRPELSTGADNLVMKAARLLRERIGSSRGAAIALTKQIPWAAGLGGGSSDAASTLFGLNELWELGLTRHELASLGGQLGSDVGFFFDAPCAWCWGRGERTKPIPLSSELFFVLVCPEVGLSTPEVFRELNCTTPAEPADESDPPKELTEALATGDVDRIIGLLRNDLEEPALRISPTVREWHSRLRDVAGRACSMSGSGSSLFALCRDVREAMRVLDDLHRGLPSEGPEPARILIVRSCNYLDDAI